MQQFVKVCVLLLCRFLIRNAGAFVPYFYGFASDLCGKCRNTVLQRFLPNAPQLSTFFCLGFERATFSPGVRLLRCKKKTAHFRKLRHTYKEDGTLSQITVHFRELRCTFGNCGALLGIAVHLQVQHNCGTAIALRCT